MTKPRPTRPTRRPRHRQTWTAGRTRTPMQSDTLALIYTSIAVVLAGVLALALVISSGAVR